MAKRTDSNQKAIVQTFRDYYADVLIMSDLGKGAPDILVGALDRTTGRRLNLLFEIKDGSKVPSARKLTPMEEKFHKEWRGQVAIISSVEEVIRIMNDLNTYKSSSIK